MERYNCRDKLVKEISAVSHAGAAGQRFDMIRIIYQAVLNKDIPVDAFIVKDRTVTDLNVRQTVDGNSCVEIMLDPFEEGTAELVKLPFTNMKSDDTAASPLMNMPETGVRSPSAYVRQIHSIRTADGMEIPSWEDFCRTERAEEELVDKFHSFRRYRLGVNLYEPALGQGQNAPLVIFIPDAGVNGNDPRIALLQGGGGTLFASESIQKDTPCFVLAFQIPSGIPFTTDEFTTAPEFEDLEKIIHEITEEYPVDMKRIYLTGQSQGCMSCCELLLRHPDRYRAALLVAGQWDPAKISEKLTHTNMWIFVSDGDEKAFPIMGEAVRRLEYNGVTVSYSYINAKDPAEKQEEILNTAIKENVHLRMTVFTDHSVVPEGMEDNGGTNHINTWPCVYRFDMLRKWLLAQ